MAFPRSREEMRAQGWTFAGARDCIAQSCKAKIEMWRNPETQAFVPMESVGPFVSHFGNCPERDKFKKTGKPTTGNLF